MSLVLVALDRDQQVVHVLPSHGEVTIGRSSDCEVSVRDPLVSRRHARLHLGDPVRLEDLGSENGTQVYIPMSPAADAETLRLADRQLRGDSVMLPEGAIVSVGASRFLLRRAEDDAVGATPPAPLNGPWIVRAPAVRAVWDLAERAAATRINVLLLGETGVGKEVLAQHIHQLSPRRDQVFLRLNCAAFHEMLLESELFGHEKGAFTGAVAAKPGLFEAADGGTILLDEVGELPAPLQGKLLRLLEQREVLRVGALRPRSVDVRLLAATNRQLDAEVAAGRFRKDLFFRLSGLTLLIPPLRERVEEIAELARAFAAELATRERRPVPALGDAAVARLEGYPWPGNVRELRNVIERALLVCGAGPIEVAHLPPEVVADVRGEDAGGHAPAPAARPRLPRAPAGPPQTADRPGDPLRQRAEELDRDQIVRALEQCAWNQTRAAEMLQMTRRALVIRLERYAIPRPRKRAR